jgi:hypothetical protein
MVSMPRWLLGLIVMALAVALLVRAFSGIDLHAAAAAILQIGPLAPLVLVPFGVTMTVDATALRWLLAAIGRTPPFRRVLAIRMGTEALHLTAPAGFLVGDSVTAALLDSRCGVPLVEGATIAVARRWLMMRAHAGYIALGAVVGWAPLVAVSMRAFGNRVLPWIVLTSALVPLLMSTILGASFRPGGLVAMAVGAGARAPWVWLRRQTLSWQAGATTIHERMARIGSARGTVWSATLAFFGCWILESCDTALILRLLGVPASFAIAVGAEVGISLVRAMGNVAPAGLGVQDAGYATLLPAMGLRPEIAAACVVVKRAKELCWIAIGYALLAVQRRAARRGGEPSRLTFERSSTPPKPPSGAMSSHS